MTAIGFFITVTGYVIGWLNDYRIYNMWAKTAGATVVIGGMLMLAGVCVKLWEIMP